MSWDTGNRTTMRKDTRQELVPLSQIVHFEASRQTSCQPTATRQPIPATNAPPTAHSSYCSLQPPLHLLTQPTAHSAYCSHSSPPYRSSSLLLTSYCSFHYCSLQPTCSPQPNCSPSLTAFTQAHYLPLTPAYCLTYSLLLTPAYLLTQPTATPSLPAHSSYRTPPCSLLFTHSLRSSLQAGHSLPIRKMGPVLPLVPLQTWPRAEVALLQKWPRCRSGSAVEVARCRGGPAAEVAPLQKWPCCLRPA
ncbi:hypothetical protein WMY93_012661 [Mugilogobius chulae]|uniref:Uncharacterized protein n=1 Tax=Mugilogobius chulae TaxID=88201 RepID=A0AAW0P6V4_9GOBI